MNLGSASKSDLVDQSLRRLVLLGPQPEYQSLQTALQRVQPDGPVALMTAGWEEDELDSDLLAPVLDSLPEGSFNLELFRRSEHLFAADVELIQLLQERQDRLRHLRNVYDMRLGDILVAARKTLRRPGTIVDFSDERESAIEMVRQLDRQYFVRTSQVCDEYDERIDFANRESVCRHRSEVAGMLDQASALVISGGHAAIILNRLRIFGVLEQSGIPVIAWSGGAMALADQVVLFHDSPPQGRGNAEVLRAGMSMFDKFLPLPNARHRLLLDDQLRVELFARRFDYYQCVIFDQHTIMDRNDGTWWASDGTERLGTNGQLQQVDVDGRAVDGKAVSS